jgi:hypothetical protein
VEIQPATTDLAMFIDTLSAASNLAPSSTWASLTAVVFEDLFILLLLSSLLLFLLFIYGKEKEGRKEGKRENHVALSISFFFSLSL